MKTRTIYVRKIEVKNKDGKTFNAYETTDTKDKKRLSVAFLRGECEPLKDSAKIEITSARMDLSKRFPVLRVGSYKVVETQNDESKNDEKLNEFLG